MKKEFKKGSILVASLLIMLMLASITIAVVTRDKESALNVISVEKGNQAYQSADRSIESVLQQIADIDDKTDGSIPENTDISSGICSGGGDANNKCIAAFFNAGNSFVSNVSGVTMAKSDINDVRTIDASLPPRVNNQGFSDFKVEDCNAASDKCAGIYGAGTTSYNKCDAKVSWKWKNPGNTADEKAKNLIEGFQVRSSEHDLLTEAGWFSTGDKAGTNNNGNTPYSFTIQNNAADFQYDYGKTYNYAIKAKNSKPLFLDSLYFKKTTGSNSNVLAVANAADCSGGEALSGTGCVTAGLQPIGSMLFNQPYTCCGGKNCYMPDPNWVKNGDAKNCANQTCQEASVSNAQGTAGGGTGHCGVGGAETSCVDGNQTTACGQTCESCYATIGYCSALPPNSTPDANIFSATPWIGNNNVDVYMDPLKETLKPRSVKHACPTALVIGFNSTTICGSPTGLHGSYTASVDNGFCTEKSANPTAAEISGGKFWGEYVATVNCTLGCENGYIPSGGKSDANTDWNPYGKLTKKFFGPGADSGKGLCCTQNQPAGNPPVCSAAIPNGIGPAAKWMAACGGGNWTSMGCCKGPAPAVADTELCAGDSENLADVDGGMGFNVNTSFVGSCTDNHKCEYVCNNTHHKSGNKCVDNLCQGQIPDHAAVYGSDEDLDITDGASYTYSATDTDAKCQYNCIDTYHMNTTTGKCEENSCAAIGIDHAVIFPGDNLSVKQIYNGTAVLIEHDGNNAVQCQYFCDDTNYHKNGNSCATNACGTISTANADWFSNDNQANIPYQDNGQAYFREKTGNNSNTNHKCEYTCTSFYHKNGASCDLNICTGTVPANNVMFANDNKDIDGDSNVAYSYYATDTGTRCQYHCDDANGYYYDTISKTCTLKVDGACNTTTTGTPVYTKPSANLCSKGTASSVSGSGPWTWKCNGSTNNGGTNADCSVSNKIDAACSATYKNQTFNTLLTAGNYLCSTGTVNTANFTSDPDYWSSTSGYFSWECLGINGGNPENNCNAFYAAPVNGGWSVDWGACNATACGTSDTQTKTCTNPAPANGGANCVGNTPTQTCNAPACAACNLPWGGTTASGTSVTAYQNSSVPFGSSCVSQTRTCANGTLSGTYTNNTCSVSAAAACNLPWGGTIASGANVTAYQYSSVAYGSTCASVSQTRTCTNGTLNGTYTNNTCSVSAAAACNLPWGGTTASGTSVTAYQNSSVACGSTCASQTRTCTNGTLSPASGAYTNSSCTVASCCGQTITSWAGTCSTYCASNGCGTPATTSVNVYNNSNCFGTPSGNGSGDAGGYALGNCHYNAAGTKTFKTTKCTCPAAVVWTCPDGWSDTSQSVCENWCVQETGQHCTST